MGSIATLEFGLGFAVIIFVAFLAYMSTFGRKSTLRQKNIAESNELL